MNEKILDLKKFNVDANEMSKINKFKGNMEIDKKRFAYWLNDFVDPFIFLYVHVRLVLVVTYETAE